MSLLKRILFKLRKKTKGGWKDGFDLSICLCGDFMLDKRIEPYLKTYGFMYPFKNLLPTLMEYDVRALNLETPVADSKGEKAPDKKFNFKADPYVAKMLGRAGINYASLANNHIFDFGRTVARETIKNLKKFGVSCGGVMDAPNPAIIGRNGYKIAFLSFMDDVPITQIRNAKKQADIVIVGIHWGEELARNASARQKKLAHEIINAGADVVWGHHPHVIQEIEHYKKGVIFYSLGNFIFSHLTPSIKRGMIAGLHIKNGKIKAISKHIVNNDNYLVRFAPRETFCHTPRRRIPNRESRIPNNH
jgi:poly-gamma-glutamate synthesis protein (capsule biosynthesis protein)